MAEPIPAIALGGITETLGTAAVVPATPQPTIYLAAGENKAPPLAQRNDFFHIYFPDPWPKSKHRKRRFFTMENLERMHDTLRIGGKVYFGTDFFDYYLQAKVLIALHHGFLIVGEPAPDAVLSSLYGRKAAGAQKPIHLFSAVRVASADEQGEEHEHQRDVRHDIQGNEKA